MAARSLDAYLNSAGGLARLSAHAGRLVKLQRVFEEIAPSFLAASSRVANFKLGKVVIHADSGAVAASAYALLSLARKTIRRVVLLGPAHRVPVRGLALPVAEAFATPLGGVRIDAEGAAAALKLPQVTASDVAHNLEHSLEVQLPFLQTVLDDFTLLPFAVGAATPAQVVFTYRERGPVTTIPAIDTYQTMRLEGSQPVYSGPGTHYYRDNATVSGGRSRVYGSENGWVLMGYGLSDGRYRIGWVDVSALPAGTVVPELTFAYRPAKIHLRQRVRAEGYQGFFQSPLNLQTHALQTFHNLHLVQQHHKLVARQTGHQILRADRFTQSLRNFYQHLVSNSVTIVVVNVLEAVQVNKQHGK